MSKEKEAAALPWFVRELFQFGIYKRNQGRISRQVTFAVIGIVLLLGTWRWIVFMGGNASSWSPVAWAVALVGLWIDFRLVNMPSFADFLIAVEAEMNKVSWPTRSELVRSSIVVIFSIFFLALILFCYDIFWREVLTLLHVGHR